MKHINLTLSDELHTRLKVVCALQNKKLVDVARKLLEEYVEKSEKKLKK